MFKKTKKFVCKHHDITKADKGNETVIMNRSDYVSKVKEMLSDDKTYTLLKKDITRTYQE